MFMSNDEEKKIPWSESENEIPWANPTKNAVSSVQVQERIQWSDNTQKPMQ